MCLRLPRSLSGRGAALSVAGGDGGVAVASYRPLSQPQQPAPWQLRNTAAAFSLAPPTTRQRFHWLIAQRQGSIFELPLKFSAYL